jgi:hypothetical protein
MLKLLFSYGIGVIRDYNLPRFPNLQRQEFVGLRPDKLLMQNRLHE